MKSPFRDILKHSAVYGLGQILTRITSILLLPFYTRYLTPADYGVVAILDVMAGVLAILIGVGVSRAVVRLHFDPDAGVRREPIWWTGLGMLVVLASSFVAPCVLFARPVADVLLGEGSPRQPAWLTIALATLWFECFRDYFETYLRVLKRSGSLVMISFGRLLLNIALNVFLIAGLRLGVEGLLVGNLLTSVVATTLLFIYFVPNCRGIGLARVLLTTFWKYGIPLVATSMLALIMQQADRCFLRMYVTKEQLGLYALAFQFAQGLNGMLLLSFGQIWHVVKFEIADHDDANHTYVQIFRCFSSLTMLIMLVLAIFIQPCLWILVERHFYSAADFVPLLCLAYVFFTLRNFVTLPSELRQQTHVQLPGSLAAVAVNLAGNATLIPLFGPMGAALTTMSTFLTLLVIDYVLCRRIEDIGFGLGKTLGLAVLLSLVYLTFRYAIAASVSPWIAYPIGMLVWLAIAVHLLCQPLTQAWRFLHVAPATVPATPEAEVLQT